MCLVVRMASSCALTLAAAFQPGIQLYGLEGRYAHALFSAASKNNALGQVEKELTAVQVRTQFFLTSFLFLSLLGWIGSVFASELSSPCWSQGSLKADASFAGFLESPVLNSAERVGMWHFGRMSALSSDCHTRFDRLCEQDYGSMEDV